MRTDTQRPGPVTTGAPAPTSVRPTEKSGATGAGRSAAPVALALALAALVVIALLAIQPWAGGADAGSTPPRSDPAVGSQEFLQRLADQGYIPQETVDQDRLLLERLVNSGRIPAETLD